MKKIILILKTHLKEDFDWKVYSLCAGFLIICIFFNYRHDFEDSVIDSYAGEELRILWYFLFYSLAYYSMCFILLILGRRNLNDRKFFSLSIIGLILLSIDAGFPYFNELAGFFSADIKFFAFKIINNLLSLVTTLLPLVILYKWVWSNESFFGLTFTNVDFRPYGIMLLLMIPPIIWASFQPDFLENYPSFPADTFPRNYNVPSWLMVLLFELAYGWDFISVELLFRGFFVIGLAKIAGKDVILPMVVTYAFLHFGKPLGETIGSVFGGYILGILACRTGNIWGGIAIHLGVAWLMELAAFVGKAI